MVFLKVACLTWTCVSSESNVAHYWTKSSTYVYPPSLPHLNVD
jgi:hypothetical protein